MGAMKTKATLLAALLGASCAATADGFPNLHLGTVDPAPNDVTNPRKLMLGRIDLWAASTRRSDSTLARLGYAGKIVPVLVFNRVHMYLACNRAVPDALVTRMNGALEAMERDGTARAIQHRYDGWGMAPRR